MAVLATPVGWWQSWQSSALLLLLLVCLSRGKERGAPFDACQTMAPGHPGTQSQTGSSGVRVTHNMGAGYERSKDYNITLDGTQFRGFFCRVQRQGTVNYAGVLGKWSIIYLPSYTRWSSCQRPSTGVTHTRTMPAFNSLKFVWTAPDLDVGPLQITCTIAKDFSTYWVAERSASIPFRTAGASGSTTATMRSTTTIASAIVSHPSMTMAVLDPTATTVLSTMGASGSTSATMPSTTTNSSAIVAYPSTPMVVLSPIATTIISAVLWAF